MKKKIISCLTLLVFCATLLPLQVARAAAPQESGSATLIVELEGAPVLAQRNAQSANAKASLESAEAQVRADQAEVLTAIGALCDKETGHVRAANSKAAQDEPSITPQYTYTHTFNGFALKVDRSLKNAIAALPGVKRVCESQPVALITPTEAAAPRTAATTDMDNMHTSALHAQNIRGQGQVIAVIDSELDVTHEMFAGEVETPALSKNAVAQLVKSGNLNIAADTPIGDVYRTSKLPFVYNYMDQTSTPISDRTHGTHVSGIAAGRGGTAMDGSSFDGIAPQAQLIFFGMDGYNGMGSDAVILAAIDDAAKLGADVINMSFSASFAVNHTLYEEVMANARRGDVLLSVAAGNSARMGANGTTDPSQADDYTIMSPANAPEAMAVAACNVSKVAMPSAAFAIEGRTDTVPYVAASRPSLRENYTATVYCGDGSATACEGKDCAGKYAVVEKGDVPLREQLENIMKAGAPVLIVIDDSDRLDSDNINNIDTFPPTLFISASDGDLFRKGSVRIKNAEGSDGVQRLPMRTEDMASFSSWGMTADLTLKPDITAPGVNIYSSMPGNDYHTYSGTSMAAPHLTGATALLRQYIESHPDQYSTLNSQGNLTPLIENLMMSTATILTQEDGVPHSPRLQGAGRVNLDAATATPVILRGDDGKSKISLRDKLKSHFTLSCEAQNLTDRAVTYDDIRLTVIGEQVASDGTRNGMRTLKADCTLADSVTVPAGGRTTISAVVRLDEATLKEMRATFKNGFFVEGYLTLASSNEDIPPVHLPFSGFYGDWCQGTALDQPFYSPDSVYGLTGLLSVNDMLPNQASFLGSNHYMLDGNDSLDDLTGAAEFVAYSPNGDGMFDKLYVGVTPLRETAHFEVTIRDAKGNTIDHQRPDAVAYKGGTTTLQPAQDKLATLPEGDYTLELKGAFNYEGSKTEQLTLPFAVDLTPPSISDWRITEVNGQPTLTFTATDNRSVMGATFQGKSIHNIHERRSDQADSRDWTTAKKGTFTFNINEINPATIDVTLYDHAGNSIRCFGKSGGPFSDVAANAWYTDAVRYMKDHDIMNGTTDTTFAPNAALSRAMMAAVLYNMEGKPNAEASDHFSDVAAGKWYSDAVNWAAENNIVSGLPNGTYAPNQALSREQMASILYRYAEYKGLAVEARADLDHFSDTDTISPWARDVVEWAVAEKLISGTTDTTLQPKTTANRAQVAAVLMNYCENVAK